MDRKYLEKLLVQTRNAMQLSEKLMKSEDEEICVHALETYISLLELETAIITALGQQEENPLARRVRSRDV